MLRVGDQFVKNVIGNMNIEKRVKKSHLTFYQRIVMYVYNYCIHF
jgi:hypothetical protein